MTDSNDNEFDRLAGQPAEPTADTDALVEAVRGKGTAFDVDAINLTGSPILRCEPWFARPSAVGRGRRHRRRLLARGFCLGHADAI